MNKKTIIQILLVTILIIASFSIFNFFYIPKEGDQKLESEKKTNIDNELNNTDKNIIKDIEYSLNNDNGNIYRVIADFGEVKIDNPDLMFLTNVTATVIFNDKMRIILTSDFADFNSKTFETTFLNNVQVKKDKEIITGDELYLVLENNDKEILNKPDIEENLIRISHNVMYKKPGYILKADILELDLISKNIKIYMLNENEKILAKSIID
tara:strand:+ start:861 stop:1493 length:633 start_codon:yes stop_codon:yes gene_type:complete